MTHRSPEENLQRAVAQYLDVALPEGAVHFHVPNGGGRTQAEGGALKAQGVKPGVPDHVVLYRGRVVFLELKASNGRVSQAQQAMHNALRDAGFPVLVCRSVEEVADSLRSVVPLRARQATEGVG